MMRLLRVWNLLIRKSKPEVKPKTRCKIVSVGRSATDVVATAMDAVTEGHCEAVLVVYASGDGTVLGWVSNIPSPVARVGLCRMAESAIFMHAYTGEADEAK